MGKHNRCKSVAPAYLAEGALHPPEEVVVPGADAVGAMDVVDFEPQLLNLLEVVVQSEDLGKHRVQVALDHFCPVQLKENTQQDVPPDTLSCQVDSDSSYVWSKQQSLIQESSSLPLNKMILQ